MEKYEKMLLKASAGRGDEATLAWNELAYERPPHEWPETWQRLLPSIWLNLKDKPKTDVVYRDRLAHRYRDSWAGNVRLRQETCEVIKLLEDSQISSILLKGLWVSLVAELDIGARPTADIDLLVPFESAGSALQLLQEKGWTRTPDDRFRPTDRLTHATELYKDNIGLDLHWFLLPECRRPGCDQEFWDRAQFQKLGDTVVRGLAPIDLIFHLCVLAEREPHQRVRYYQDLHQVWSVHGHNISLDSVKARLRERHLLTRGLLPLATLGEDRMKESPGWFDQTWSRSTQAIHDGSHEFFYALYPFLDYYLHYRTPEPDWGLREYLRQRLRIGGMRDLVSRTNKKLLRTLTGGRT